MDLYRPFLTALGIVIVAAAIVAGIVWLALNGFKWWNHLKVYFQHGICHDQLFFL